MSKVRAVLATIGLSVFVTASVMAFVTLSVPAVRDAPRLGLLVAASVFLTVLTILAVAFSQRK